jgi:Protein of unknown function (DUF2568)
VIAWTVLALVFLDEVLAAVAAGVWGWHAGGWLLAVGAPLAVVAVWWLFASPKAPYGGPVVRPVVKVLVFGLASLGLVAAGHTGWGVALLVFSVVVNAAAQLPSVRAVLDEGGQPARP